MCYHIWAWQPSLSCDQDISINLCALFRQRLQIKIGFDWSCGFREKDVENNGHMHVFSNLAGTDNPMGSFDFSKL